MSTQKVHRLQFIRMLVMINFEIGLVILLGSARFLLPWFMQKQNTSFLPFIMEDLVPTKNKDSPQVTPRMWAEE